MGWTTPRTWATNDFADAAMLNQHIRDELNFLKQNYTQSFRGLLARRHPDHETTLANRSKIMVTSLDEVVMNDGTRYSGLTLPLVCDLQAAGAGGLDTGARAASAWYEYYLIGKSSTNAAADCQLLLHRQKTWDADQAFATNDSSTLVRQAAGTTKLAQSFQPTITGQVPFVDLFMAPMTGSPSGRMWVTLEADAAGVPSGTPLATSDKMLANGMWSSGSNEWVRFIFRALASLTLNTTYWIVLQGDWTIDGANYVSWRYQSTGGYTRGVQAAYNGSSWSVNAGIDLCFVHHVVQNDTAVTMPAGYDQKCLLGYWYNTSVNALQNAVQRDRLVTYVQGMTITSGLTDTSPSQFSNINTKVYDAIPPVPVTVFLEGSQVTATDVLKAAGCPEGYDPTTGVKLAAGTGGMCPIATEAQALYLSTSAGTAGAIVRAWQF